MDISTVLAVLEAYSALYVNSKMDNEMADEQAVRKRIVLLTGGIASGKTFASDYLQAKGAEIIDTDLIARMMTRPDNEMGRSALTEIQSSFGNEYILSDGTMNRALMRELVFNDEAAKKNLERILHGRIKVAVDEAIGVAMTGDAPYILLVVPIIYPDSAYLDMCDEVLVIEVPYQLQLQRVMARDNIDKVLAEKIIQSQISRLDRRRLGNDIVISENQVFVERTLDQLHTRYSVPVMGHYATE